MKIHIKTTICSVFLLLLVACKEQSIEINMHDEEKKALVGEINQIDTVKISLIKTGNLINATPFTPIENTAPSLLNFDNEIISDFIFTKKKWIAKQLPNIQTGKEYSISAQILGEKISATTKIPLPLTTELVKMEKINLAIYMDLKIANPNDQDAFCVIELLSRSFETTETGENVLSETYTCIPIQTTDEYTDNIKYNELISPFNRIFIPLKKQTEKTLRFYVDDINIESQNTKNYLWIKSLESIYYQHTYNYELQNNQSFVDSSLQIQFNGNIINGIGIWGGCYKIELPISFL